MAQTPKKVLPISRELNADTRRRHARPEPRRSRARTVLGAGSALIVALVGALYVLLDRPFLAANYSYDEQKIQSIAQGTVTLDNDQSFQFVGDIYRVLGMADEPLLAAIAGYGLFVATICLSLGGSRLQNLSLSTFTILIGSFVLAAVYLGHYSKDVFVLPVSMIAILALKSRRPSANVVLLAAIVAYALLFRTYWMIIGAIFVTFLLILKRKIHWFTISVGIVIILMGMAIVFSVSLGVPLDQYRVQVNDARASAQANTVIHQFIPGSSIPVAVLNCAVVLVNFLIPIGLVTSGGAIQVGVAVFLAYMWIMIIRAVVKSRTMALQSPGMLRAIALLLALLTVQSVFEPDYGSYVRHLSPFIPLALALMLHCRQLCYSTKLTQAELK